MSFSVDNAKDLLTPNSASNFECLFDVFEESDNLQESHRRLVGVWRHHHYHRAAVVVFNYLTYSLMLVVITIESPVGLHSAFGEYEETQQKKHENGCSTNYRLVSERSFSITIIIAAHSRSCPPTITEHNQLRAWSRPSFDIFHDSRCI